MKHHFHFLIQFLFASTALAWAHGLFVLYLSYRFGVAVWPVIGLFLGLGLLFCSLGAGIRAIPAKRHLSWEGKIVTGTFFMAIAGGLTLFWLNIFSAIEKPRPERITWEQQQRMEREAAIKENLAHAEELANQMRKQ